MKSGEVEANLVRLNEEYELPQIPDLIARKHAGTEKGVLEDADLHFHRREFERLRAELEKAREDTHLPEAPSAKATLSDLLVLACERNGQEQASRAARRTSEWRPPPTRAKASTAPSVS